LKDDVGKFNKVVIEGKISESEFIDKCETLPMLSERKLIIVKKSAIFKPKNKGTKQKAEKTKSKKGTMEVDFPSYMANIPNYSVIIFYEDEVDKRTKIYDSLNKNGFVVDFPLQKPNDLLKWVIGLFRENGKNIESRAAEEIIEYSDLSMNSIYNEIQKIILYAKDDKCISKEIIQSVITKSMKARIFDLTDSIAERNCEKAIKIFDEIIMMKEPVQKIHYMITKHIGNLLKVKYFQKDNLTSLEISKLLGVVSFSVQKLLKQSRNFSIEVLKEAYEVCLENDIASKTGLIDIQDATYIFIVKYANNKV
jgi:DNA polymerase III subunit delta